MPCQPHNNGFFHIVVVEGIVGQQGIFSNAENENHLALSLGT